MNPGDKVKITYSNHVRRGVLHGTVKEKKDAHVYLELFIVEETKDGMKYSPVVPIQIGIIEKVEHLN